RLVAAGARLRGGGRRTRERRSTRVAFLGGLTGQVAPMQPPAVAEGDEGSRVQVLRSLLTVARELVGGRQGNPQFVRLVNLFARMPEGDRDIILGALEREVQTRLLSQEVADTLTKIDLRPNPNARIYLRVVGPEDRSDDVEMLAFMRAAYSLQRGID